MVSKCLLQFIPFSVKKKSIFEKAMACGSVFSFFLPAINNSVPPLTGEMSIEVVYYFASSSQTSWH